MNIVELFCGTKSFTNVAKQYGHNVFTSDFNSEFNSDYCVDILNFDISKIPFDKVDIVWASPPCTSFSVASIGHHWNKDNTPKTKEAEIGVMIVKKTIEIIKQLNPKYYYGIIYLTKH